MTTSSNQNTPKKNAQPLQATSAIRQTTSTLVVSDLHFGDTRCTLHSMRTAEALVAKLSPFAPLTDIVLLGDILDLQLANWAQAVEGMILATPAKRAAGFRYFINFLLRETGARRITYVPGNHDYRIFDYHSVERSLLRPLRNGKKLSGKTSFFRTFPESFLQGLLTVPDAKIQVVYPHHTIRVNGERIILTHGHFFDPTQAFNHEIGKIFSKTGPLSRDQIVRLRQNYFRRVSLYQNLVSGISMRKDLRDWFSSLYQPVTSWKQKFQHRQRKQFLTDAMKRSIEHYVTFCCRPGRVHGVIFGHTHRPGTATLQNGPVRYVWNCGSFLRESSQSPLGSFITIRNGGKMPITEAIQVHQL